MIQGHKNLFFDYRKNFMEIFLFFGVLASATLYLSYQHNTIMTNTIIILAKITSKIISCFIIFDVMKHYIYVLCIIEKVFLFKILINFTGLHSWYLMNKYHMKVNLVDALILKFLLVYSWYRNFSHSFEVIVCCSVEFIFKCFLLLFLYFWEEYELLYAFFLIKCFSLYFVKIIF